MATTKNAGHPYRTCRNTNDQFPPTGQGGTVPWKQGMLVLVGTSLFLGAFQLSWLFWLLLS